jgi:hypothetical protein
MNTPAAARGAGKRGVSAAIAALLGFAMIFVGAPVAASAAVDSSYIEFVPLVTDSAKYKGIGANVKVLAGGVAEVQSLTEVRITVKRSSGGDVVKSSTSDAVLTELKAGRGVTAPIIIQPGTYDEAGSTSWTVPNATWTSETVPTSVMVELLAGDTVIGTKTAAAPATIGTVMPAPAPEWNKPIATANNAALYKGVAVNIRVKNVTDATGIIVQVNRNNAPPVIKTAKQGPLDNLNQGGAQGTTAPIIIQPGTYDEAGSSSWYPAPAVWTPTSIPTTVTITITRSGGPDMVTTIPVTGDLGPIMPATVAPVEFTVPTDAPLDVSIPEDAGEVTLNLGTPVGGELTVPVDVTVTTSIGVEVVIPAGTTVTAADPAWDGVISAPTVRDDVVVPAAAGQKEPTVSLAIAVGSDDTRLDFGTPVKLVLAGQAGQKAGFVSGGVFSAITTQCASPTPALASGECWINDGADLVIWTTHFTTFVAYAISGAALANSGVEDIVLPIGVASLLIVLGTGAVVAGRGRRIRTIG